VRSKSSSKSYCFTAHRSIARVTRPPSISSSTLPARPRTLGLTATSASRARRLGMVLGPHGAMTRGTYAGQVRWVIGQLGIAGRMRTLPMMDLELDALACRAARLTAVVIHGQHHRYRGLPPCGEVDALDCSTLSVIVPERAGLPGHRRQPLRLLPSRGLPRVGSPRGRNRRAGSPPGRDRWAPPPRWRTSARRLSVGARQVIGWYQISSRPPSGEVEPVATSGVHEHGQAGVIVAITTHSHSARGGHRRRSTRRSSLPRLQQSLR
jgi:hypothetical protein